MNKEIRHSFQFSCEPNVLLSVLTEEKHIRNWWTNGATVQASQGIFEWKTYGWRVELIIQNESNRTVTWKCTKSNMQNTDAWEGSVISFELRPEGSGTRLNFRHSNYRSSPCYDVCHDGWQFVLGKSLMGYLETGKGLPYSLN